MKKFLFLNSIVLLVTTLLFVGCGKPKLKKTRALVRTVVIDDDTLKYMTVQTGEDGDTTIFDVKEARLQNGLMMPHDSVIIDYIDGKNDTSRAFVVTVLPKASVPVDPSSLKGNKLQTASDKAIEEAKKDNN